MPSKKSARDKRASLPRLYDFERQFEKDWERLSRTGRFDMVRLKTVMMLLIANDAPLGPEWVDHALGGGWKDCRDCHVHGDFVLIYRIETNTVVFVRAGTHADLFE